MKSEQSNLGARHGPSGDFFSEVSSSVRLKLILATATYLFLVLPASALVNLGFSPRLVVPLSLALVLPFQYVVYRLRRRHIQLRNSRPFETPAAADSLLSAGGFVLSEGVFRRILALERKRAERSGVPFRDALILLDGVFSGSSRGHAADEPLVAALMRSVRDTDTFGWYKNHLTVGILCPDIHDSSTAEALLSRVVGAVRREVPPEQASQIRASFHEFPGEGPLRQADVNRGLIVEPARAGEFADVAKRMMDIVGSALALAFLAPLFLAIAALIKLTSKGPVFFRQSRIGQYGMPFVLLKFRSMYAYNDPAPHLENTRKPIAGTAPASPADWKQISKLKGDPRITPVGAFLRRNSLDELPQFLSVLTGKMSLVGPRPPAPSEVEAYDKWHLRRVLEIKPGITGLWRVGNDRVNMVKPSEDGRYGAIRRLDLKYLMNYSLSLDFEILRRTTFKVIRSWGGAS